MLSASLNKTFLSLSLSHGGPVKVGLLSLNDTHTRAFHTPDVSSSAESGNPHIWNPTTVAIFGMIGTLSEHKPVTVCCTALQTALSSLSRIIVFCNCRDSDVGIIVEYRINYGTVPARIRQRRFAFRQDLDAIWTQSVRKGNENIVQIMPIQHDNVPIHG